MRDIFLLKLSGGAFYLKLSPDTRKKRKVFKLCQPVIHGWYDEIDGHLLAVYRIEENLYVSVDSNEFLLSQVATEFDVKGKHAMFKLIVAKDVVFQSEYERKAFKGLNKYELNHVESNDDLLCSLHTLVNNSSSWEQTFNYSESESYR